MCRRSLQGGRPQEAVREDDVQAGAVQEEAVQEEVVPEAAAKEEALQNPVYGCKCVGLHLDHVKGNASVYVRKSGSFVLRHCRPALRPNPPRRVVTIYEPKNGAHFGPNKSGT